jgi:predicted RND superfamily exporter protein
MLGTSFRSLVMISVILIFTVRSLKLGLMNLVPNLAPAIMAFGLWGLFIGRVGLDVSIIVSATLGIVVDDTIHFMGKYLRAHREHGKLLEGAIRYSFNTVGSALIISSFLYYISKKVLS